jgi:hypothetical protein
MSINGTVDSVVKYQFRNWLPPWRGLVGLLPTGWRLGSELTSGRLITITPGKGEQRLRALRRTHPYLYGFGLRSTPASPIAQVTVGARASNDDEAHDP